MFICYFLTWKAMCVYRAFAGVLLMSKAICRRHCMEIWSAFQMCHTTLKIFALYRPYPIPVRFQEHYSALSAMPGGLPRP